MSYRRRQSYYSRITYSAPRQNSVSVPLGSDEVFMVVFMIFLCAAGVIFLLYDLLKNPWVIVIGVILVPIATVCTLLVSTKKRCFSQIKARLDCTNVAIPFNFDYMSGTEFEMACAKVLSANGFSNIRLTKGSGDYGVDILCNLGVDRYAIQCKRYKSNVGIQAVQQVESGCHYYNCNKAVVMTNGYFTEAATNLANKNGIILWNRNFLYRMVQTQYKGKSQDEARIIGYAYMNLFKKVFKRDIRILAFDSDPQSLRLEYILKGDIKELGTIVGELDGVLGYHHVIDESENGCRMVVTKQ